MNLFVLSTIKHNGKIYEEGETLEVSLEASEALIEIGVAKEMKERTEPANSKKKAVKKDPKESTPEKPSRKWTHPRLMEYAAEQGVEVSKEDSKRVILEKLGA